MRYVSQIFQPVITIPKNAKIKNTEITCKSQKLLLECGLVRPTSSGLFALLPLARRALDKLETIVRQCVEAAGAQRVTLPSLTAAHLWEKTGRLEDVGSELLTVKDRHKKEYLLAPTHEEAIADLLADVGPVSYKQLPLVLYQISNKYRDEQRPKHGLLRARSFAMLDAYAAHASAECSRAVYERMTQAYSRLFERLQLPVYRVSAPTGDMGGSLSHEWQVAAAAGEDTIHVCPSCSHAALGEGPCKCGRETDRVSSIEVGHTFILGTKYSDPLRATFVPAAGAPQPLIMSCYGIGITRLLAASLEALSTETSMRWPRAIAPYSAVIIGPKEGSKEWQCHGEERVLDLWRRVAQTQDTVIDDRHSLTVGKRLMMADKLGYPTIIVCGKAVLETPPRYELHCLYQTRGPRLVTMEELLDVMREEECVGNGLEANKVV
ncbi:probable proline--tRNA ligase, mitochondrial [Ostrinia furnacalis]|uniref:probable proline--tRNA ligase, mitochondrial n=1 Tax=Ostrinia furnacalis TaxID=93504 RepID=UPI001039CBDF|nr:probable proline--tRNA ligase, mitochondrial [Ostrinia furnacalis]